MRADYLIGALSLIYPLLFIIAVIFGIKQLIYKKEKRVDAIVYLIGLLVGIYNGEMASGLYIFCKLGLNGEGTFNVYYVFPLYLTLLLVVFTKYKRLFSGIGLILLSFVITFYILILWGASMRVNLYFVVLLVIPQLFLGLYYSLKPAPVAL